MWQDCKKPVDRHLRLNLLLEAELCVPGDPPTPRMLIQDFSCDPTYAYVRFFSLTYKRLLSISQEKIMNIQPCTDHLPRSNHDEEEEPIKSYSGSRP